MINNHLIIGTAGHIDHGKTTLIKALTNIDTDRLLEEKKRGITIVLGYAHLTMGSLEISFVDVPGHEKFVKNMLAGATGMDAVMLVIAADEGIMPQTSEHFSIITHLDIKTGLVVLTKCDLVDKETITNRKNEIREFLKGSNLNTAPIFEFSAKDQSGLKAITEYFNTFDINYNSERAQKHPRMYLDRAFTLKGKGTVVTGTLTEGTLNEGDEVTFYPGDLRTKIKSLQVHGNFVKTAMYGQRVAANISLPLSAVEVGMLMAKQDQLQSHSIIDVNLSTDYKIQHWDRIRFFIGTREVFGRVATPNQEILEKGATYHVQLRLEEPIYANIGDRYIIRRFSPVLTIGGGTIENLNAVKHQFYMASENDKTDGIDKAFKLAISQINSPFSMDHKAFKTLGYSDHRLSEEINAYLVSGNLIKLNDQYYISKELYETYQMDVYSLLSKWHELNPYKQGLDRATVKSKCFGDWSKSNYDGIMSRLIQDQYIKRIANEIAVYDFEIVEDTLFVKIKENILALMKEKTFTITSFGELKNIVAQSNHYDIFTYLNYLKIIVKIDEDYYMIGNAYQEAIRVLHRWFETNDSLSVAQFRDHLDISRKATIVMLEHFDAIGMTKRIENKRILIK